MRADKLPRLTPGRRRLLDRLLDDFLELEGEGRAQELERFKRRYPRLHVWLERLLAVAATPTEHFSSAVARTAERAIGRVEDLPELAAGQELGAWRIVGQAGKGGMGVVYQAERADGAFEMTAAIKLIASRRPDVADRLVQERHLLARLNHPGLSRLIDGGLTEDGLAYLVMEWVPGQDLSEPVRGGLDPLQTFAEIADALTHAHQRMVVHGDIKPGNVRISPDGRARLLDFGVARLVADEIGDDDVSVRALTPAFAAPELLAGQPATAQSDVWALGALLNWLLTGKRPTGDGSAPDTAGIGHARAADLAAIIRTACADDPAGRYPTVAALADEVQRIRRHHPVQARVAGPARRMRLWSRRNPVGAALALALLLGTVIGASVLGWQAQVVRAERDMAQFENTRWAIMNDQLATLFRVVAEEADNDELGARELLDGSIDRLDELLAEDDRGRAYIESMLGSLYVALQDYQNAAAVLRRFVGSDAGDTTPMLRSDAYGNLALAETYLGNHERALELVDQALVMVERRPGDHRQRIAQLYQIRGSALRGLGDLTASTEALEQGLSLTRALDSASNRALARAYNNLGVTLIQASEFDAARQAFESSWLHWRVLGLAESSDALTVIGNLATIYHRQGDLPAAELAYAEAIELRRARFGDSAALAATMNNYGQVLIVRNRLDQAREQLEQARDMMGRFNGERSPHYAIMLRSLGLLELTEGQADQAADKFAGAEAILLDTVGPDHLFTAMVRSHAAQLLAQHDQAAAIDRFDELVGQMSDMGAPAEIHLAGVLCEQAVVLLEMDRPETALISAERCLNIRRARLPEGNWETLKAKALVSAAEFQLGETTAGEALASRLVSLADTYGPGHPRLAWLEARLDR